MVDRYMRVGNVMINVWDSGIGMAEGKRKITAGLDADQAQELINWLTSICANLITKREAGR